MKTVYKMLAVLFFAMQGMNTYAQCCSADAGTHKSTCCGCVTIGGNPSGKDTCGIGCDSILYRWMPATGLNNPNIANPCSNPGAGHTITYTLTVYAVNPNSPFDTCCVSTNTVSVTGAATSCCRESGIANNQSPDESIKVYPNPASQIFTIEIREELMNGSVQVYDLSGKLMWQKQGLVGIVNLNVDLSAASKGVYFIKVKDGSKGLFSRRILLQ